MIIYAPGCTAPPDNLFGGTIGTKSADLTTAIEAVPELGPALTKFGEELAKQYREGSKLGHTVIGVHLHGIEFSLVLDPRLRLPPR